MLLPPENIRTWRFSSTVWRVIPHPARDEWAIELRDASQRVVSWALLDLESQAIRWNTRPEATEWGTFLTAFAGNNLYLHNYRHADIPEPTDLLAVSAGDGSLRWAVPGVVFAREVGESGKIIIAQKHPESVQYRLCNPASGALEKNLPEADLPSVGFPAYAVPVRYEPENIYYPVLSSFLNKLVQVPSPAAIDYLESDPYVVFSYYLYEQEKVAQYLLIINRKRDILYHEVLSKNRGGVGRDTILLKKNCLICLRGTNELISIKLTS